jgi:hypothetical protein
MSLKSAVMGYWFAKSNYGSLYRILIIDCKYAGLNLSVGAAIYENGKRIGGNGEWITLIKRRHTLTVECDQLGAAKRSQFFVLDLLN